MGEEQENIPQNLYAIVKAFLKEFYAQSKKGTIKHARGLSIVLSFGVLCFLILAAGIFKVSETAWFCGRCHNMTVYVASWKASKHKDIACIECHYKPGFVNHVKGKWRDGQLSLAYFITGKRPTKPHAEIDDESCTQCHKKEDLKKAIVFKNVIFNHQNHLERMKREKQLRCTTCHSQIVQGAHITVTEVECFICHFYKTREQKAYITGCTSCHFEPKGDISISASFTFNHKRYIARGIKCESCHANVVSGDGHIMENACLKCHNRREIVEAKFTPEFMHRNHVTDHKVECFECHAGIKHKIVPLHYTGEETSVCSECHKATIHAAKVSLYVGKGARSVEETPKRMAIVNMDCSVCHEPGQDKARMEKKCAYCHGNLTDGMVDRWKKILKDKADEIQKAILETRAVQAGGQVTKEVKTALDGAAHNYNLLRRGNGVHNIIYSVKIADATRNRLREVTAASRRETVKSAPFKLSCTYTCHGNIIDRKIPFGEVQFVHEMHIEGEGSCLKCHSPYSNHGQKFLKGCSECHHGEGMGKVTCKDCHRPEETLIRAKGSMHSSIACTDCHDNIKQGKKERESIATVRENCVRCHDKGYAATADGWVKRNKEITAQCKTNKADLEGQIAAIEAKDGRHSVPLRKVFEAVCGDISMLIEGKYTHNPVYGDAILARAQENLLILKKMIKDRQEDRSIVLK
jgi:hypothetical protein